MLIVIVGNLDEKSLALRATVTATWRATALYRPATSLSGSANEDHVRSVGADGYVAKFVAEDLAETIRRVLPK